MEDNKTHSPVVPTELQKNYEEACERYVTSFSQKQNIHFVKWFRDVIGGFAIFHHNNTEIKLSMQDIIFDINSRQDPGVIIRWSNLPESSYKLPYCHYVNYLNNSIPNEF